MRKREIVPTSTAGSTTNNGVFLFLAADEQTCNITVETLDSDDNVLFSETMNAVPLKRNRVTTLMGAIYSASASASSFQVNKDWLTSHNVNF